MTTATTTTAPPRHRSLFPEILGVLLITVGSVVPLIPWLVGIALVWASDRWRTGEKLLATLVWPLGYFAVMVAGLFPATSNCVTTSTVGPGGASHATSTCHSALLPGGIVLWSAVLVLPLLVGGYLLVQARRRAALSPR